MKRLLLLVVLLAAATTALTGQTSSDRASSGRGTVPIILEQPPAPADAFFDDTVVHDVYLTINSKDWQSLRDHYLENTYYPIDFTWRDQVVRNSGIRSRGTGSRSGIKPGLRVDFDRYVNGQQFLGLKSFVFRNNTQDASNLHERLSMLLFRREGLLAPREAHARLFINKAYAGLYTIVESIDKGFLKRYVGEDSGYLYKYDYPPDAAPYYFEDRGSDPALYVPEPFKPETNESDPRPEFIVNLVKTINEASTANFRADIEQYVDLRRFVRHVAVERFVADQDGFLSDYGGMNNYYFYRFNNQNLFTWIGWDKSEAFKGGFQYPILHYVNDVPDQFKNRLFSRVLTYRDVYNDYLDALMECVALANEQLVNSTDKRGWLEREIEREYNQIRTYEYADPEKAFTNDQFEQDVQALTTFAQQRGAIVTQQVTAARAAQP